MTYAGITTEEIIWAVARAWCHPDNEQKVMDERLAMAAVDEVMAVIRAREAAA